MRRLIQKLREDKAWTICVASVSALAMLGWYAFAQGLREERQYKFGAIDPSGHLMVQPKYDSIKPFSEGLASVAVGNKWGVIDKNGQIVVEPTLNNEPGFFKEGLATLWFGRERGFINKTGTQAISKTFDNAGDFSGGLAAVEIGSKWGYIDRTGNVVIPPRFAYAWEFSEGLAGVKLADKVGFIDRTGKFVIPPTYYWTFTFKHGMATVQFGDMNKSDQWGLINREGKVLIRPGLINGFEGVTDDELMRSASESSGKYGFYNTKGELVIPCQFDADLDSMESTGWFSEGLAAVQSQQKFGYIDKTGKMYIQPKFDFAGPFHKGLAAVKVGNQYGYIGVDGNFVIKPTFDLAAPFWENRATVGFK